MTKKEVLQKFKQQPYFIRMGAGSLSRKFKCSKQDIYNARAEYYNERNNPSKNQLKILTLDLETTPLKSYTWGLWNQNVNLSQIITDWFCICWSAKWMHDSIIYTGVCTPTEMLQEDDKRIMKNLWDLVNEADVIVTYNGKKFDIKKFNSRFLIHGFQPPASYYSIDLCEIAKREFGFSSNKLDNLAKHLGIECKLTTTFELWKQCLEGDKDALNYMSEYNILDILILEDLYVRMRPWIKGHPNVALVNTSNYKTCPVCGSSHLTKEKFYYTNVSKYVLYRCECGALSRDRNNIKQNKENILTNNLR